MGETSSCNCCAVAAPGGGPGGMGAAAGAGADDDGAVATLGCADGAAAGWSPPREQPIIGELDIRTAAARINGSDRRLGLVSNVIIKNPRVQLATEGLS